MSIMTDAEFDAYVEATDLSHVEKRTIIRHTMDLQCEIDRLRDLLADKKLHRSSTFDNIVISKDM